MWSVNLRTYLVTLVLFVVILCPVAMGGTIYVDADATGTNDGSSWTNAYNRLQDALADANSTSGTVQICVAEGIYTPDRNSTSPNGTGDREATFKLINDVIIKGGYAGFSAPDPYARDIDKYETILSGDLAGNDVDINDPCDFPNQPTRADNCYHVVTGSYMDPNSVLDGFTIASGNAEPPTLYAGSTPTRSMGGGMYIVSGSPTVADCTFVKNLAGEGGGMYNQNSRPKLIDCIFSSNFADMESELVGHLNFRWCGHGGGMYNIGSSPMLTNCTFTSNCAEASGGGMRNKYKSRPTLHNCEFNRNSAESGGGMDNNQSTSTLTNCSFSQNLADNRGGGMDNNQSTPMLTNCTFSGNLAERRGGGMSSNSSSPALVNCRFTDNRAYELGGAMYNRESSTTLANCIFNGNSTGWAGGGMYSYNNTSLTLTNCTFVGNSGKDGNALHCDSFTYPSILRLVNCILWDSGDEISNSDDSTIIINYSNIQSGWPGEGNINADPLFADPGYWADADDPNIIVEPNDPNAVWIDGDYHLKSQAGRWDPVSESWIQDDVTSPCIDAGDPNSPIGHEPFPNGGIINMGAYGGTAEASKSYFGKPVCETIIAGDINGDCKVDFDDLMILINHWLQDYTPQD